MASGGRKPPDSLSLRKQTRVANAPRSPEDSAMHTPEDSLIAGWDFSTGGVKCLAFDLGGQVVAEVRLPTDLWTADGVSELNLMQLEGQARASVRDLAAQLGEMDCIDHWLAGGIPATH